MKNKESKDAKRCPYYKRDNLRLYCLSGSKPRFISLITPAIWCLTERHKFCLYYPGQTVGEKKPGGGV